VVVVVETVVVAVETSVITATNILHAPRSKDTGNVNLGSTISLKLDSLRYLAIADLVSPYKGESQFIKDYLLL